MKNLLLALAAGLALGAGAAGCTPNNQTDSLTNNDAAATDTVGARQQLEQDRAGIRMDSAGAKPLRRVPAD